MAAERPPPGAAGGVHQQAGPDRRPLSGSGGRDRRAPGRLPAAGAASVRDGIRLHRHRRPDRRRRAALRRRPRRAHRAGTDPGRVARGGRRGARTHDRRVGHRVGRNHRPLPGRRADPAAAAAPGDPPPHHGRRPVRGAVRRRAAQCRRTAAARCHRRLPARPRRGGAAGGARPRRHRGRVAARPARRTGCPGIQAALRP